jgi:hypothetical protein
LFIPGASGVDEPVKGRRDEWRKGRLRPSMLQPEVFYQIRQLVLGAENV